MHFIACGNTYKSPLSFACMAGKNHRELFAERLRSLRIAGDLTIEQASGQGELSSNFWGAVERNEQEPCLDSLYGFAKGLGISPDALLRIDDKYSENDLRPKLNDLLDLCSPHETQLVHQIATLIYRANRPTVS
jgi:transcriptional regulator with XRE-family HTH domain